MEFHGKCPNPPWKSMEKFPWNSMEIDVLILHGIPWRIFHGIPWNSMEVFHTGNLLSRLFAQLLQNETKTSF